MIALIEHLDSRSVDVFVSEHLDLDVAATRLPESQLGEAVDLIIAVGGDGTMLYAFGIADRHGVPLLGVNRGRLGFLADVTPDEMLTSIDSVLGGDYSRESRLMLRATLTQSDGTATTTHALNDIVLQRRETGRMVDFETRVDGRYVNTHAGDGLIVATPTGSTAYALSCGGPIIEPALDAVVVVPICPHTLSDRPIVLPASQTIEVSVLERDATKAEITADGVSIGDIEPGDVLSITAAHRRATLIHPPGHDYYEILRSKLYWGRDNRRRTTDAASEHDPCS